jgi:ATP-dependent Clp protease ATP-binding subunit ClpA
MFERFTHRARATVVAAQDEARRAGANHIGTEHLLMGMLAVGEGKAYEALQATGITLESVRAETDRQLGRRPGGFAGDDADALRTIGIDLDAVTESVERSFGPGALAGVAGSRKGHIPFTPGAKKVLELSLREALQLGHNYIGTEHVLLGLIRGGDGLAVTVLKAGGVDLAELRDRVVAGIDAPGKDRTSDRSLLEFGRLSSEALASIGVARAEAERTGAPTIGTEHLLLALLETGPTGVVLAGAGITADGVRSAIARHKPRLGSHLVERFRKRVGPNPTPTVKKTLECALREAMRRGDANIANHDLLLGILDNDSGLAMKIIQDSGVSPDELRARLITELGEAA